MDGKRSSTGFPFAVTKIPVCHGVDELQALRRRYPDYSICPYLAYKDTEGWNKSTSRVYMNQVLAEFLYIPVNIEKGDLSAIKRFFEQVKSDRKVVAVNITQPHKSNPVLMAEFSGAAKLDNIDTLIRNKVGQLVPFDLNAPSFMDWYSQEVGSMWGRTVVLVGVGGVGEPLARRIAGSGVSKLLLVDHNNKSALVAELAKSVNLRYEHTIYDLGAVADRQGIIVINAAGKEGAVNSGLQEWLKNNSHKNNVYVDLRPQLDIEIVEYAKSLGWASYTGYGMNARNDYSLLTGIAEVMGKTPPSFEEFKQLVAKAS